MEAAHRGPTDAINGAARNVGLTLEGLVHKESPGLHNHELVTLANMSRRLELFLRLSQGGVIFPGGDWHLGRNCSGSCHSTSPKK